MSEHKKLEIKGLIGAAAAALAILSYIVYYYFFYEVGIKLNELLFICTGLSISLFSGLLFTFFRNKIAKALTLFCSVFYLFLVGIYTVYGLLFGTYYANIKLSLIIGLAAGISYLIYDTINHRRAYGI